MKESHDSLFKLLKEIRDALKDPNVNVKIKLTRKGKHNFEFDDVDDLMDDIDDICLMVDDFEDNVARFISEVDDLEQKIETEFDFDGDAKTKRIIDIAIKISKNSDQDDQENLMSQLKDAVNNDRIEEIESFKESIQELYDMLSDLEEEHDNAADEMDDVIESYETLFDHVDELSDDEHEKLFEAKQIIEGKSVKIISLFEEINAQRERLNSIEHKLS